MLVRSVSEHQGGDRRPAQRRWLLALMALLLLLTTFVSGGMLYLSFAAEPVRLGAIVLTGPRSQGWVQTISADNVYAATLAAVGAPPALAAVGAPPALASRSAVGAPPMLVM